MRPLLAALAFSLCYYSYSSANQTATPTPQRVTSQGNSVTISDDSHGVVELEFVFPFYGEEFETAYMYDNGVLGFQDPSQAAGGGYGNFCCNAMDLTSAMQNATGSLNAYSYAIFVLWTDLLDIGATDSGYFEQGDENSHTFFWKNIAEYGQNLNLNTFDVTIKPDGSYSINYDTVKITNHAVGAGSTGDLSNIHNETYDASTHGIQHFFFANGYDSAVTGALATANNYQFFCATNALYDPTCPGYAQALAEQQYNQACAADPLYDAGCPGYAEALYNQQCEANPLSDSGCPGYAEALFNQQCEADPLFDAACDGYAEALFNQQCTNDPLFDEACPGYAEALFSQQCTNDPLFDVTCPGFFDASCEADPLFDAACPGYSVASFNQQCTNDPTSDPSCPDYYVAMCEEDPLFDVGCLGYEVAFLEQQCLIDPQFDNTCPGFVDEGDIVVLDPVIDDIISVDTDFAAAGVTDFTVDIPFGDNFVQEETFELPDTFESDISEELNDLDTMDVESEIASMEMEQESSEESLSPVERMMGTAREDEIEEDIQVVEDDTDSGDEESLAPEDIQVADSGDELGKQPAPGRSVPKPKIDPVESKRNKLKLLIAMKAVQAVKELEQAVTLEQQMNIQRRLLALISFVPDFRTYAEQEQINQVNFYPPKPTVDHAFARWFLNDPNFGAMEDLQYEENENGRNRIWGD